MGTYRLNFMGKIDNGIKKAKHAQSLHFLIQSAWNIVTK